MEKVERKERQISVENNDDSGRTTIVRVFVGGLGDSTTADDITKTFSSLGEIKGLDIIRTKGRSFAYMDYLPASENALSKLFSMFNGCAWKGGRLKLERAKEHYLDRMRREWAEDAQQASTPPSNDIGVDKKLNLVVETKKFPKLEKKEIRIFIPKLRKVKSLPYYGSGKHKYSFQRIEVPALPAHFCDCEEHFDTSYAVKTKHFPDFEMQNDGMNEEVGIMNAVMSKLFGRKHNVNAASVGTTATELDGLAAQADDSIESVPDILVENEVDPDDLDDNLIINIVDGGNDRVTLQAFPRKQESRSAQPQTPTDKKAKNKHNIQERNRAPSDNKRKIVAAEANDGNGMSAFIPENKLQTPMNKKTKNKHNIQEKMDAPPNKKRKILLAEANDGNGIVASVPEAKLRSQAADFKSSLSRFQKSSWKELVDTSGTNQFSISHILQGSPSKEKKQHKIDGSNVPNTTEGIPSSDLEHETVNLCSKETEKPEAVQPTEPIGVETKSVKGSTSRQHEALKMHPNEMARAGPEAVEPAKRNGLENKSGTGTASEAPKFSWKQLIQGGGDGSMFSIAQVVPGISHPEKEEAAKTDFVNAFPGQKSNVSFGDQFKGFGLAGKDGSLGAPPRRRSNMADGPVWKRKKQQSSNMGGDRKDSAPEPPSVAKKCGAAAAAAGTQSSPGVGDGLREPCVFMRSADSMKEWAATKAALMKSLKKKSPEK